MEQNDFDDDEDVYKRQLYMYLWNRLVLSDELLENWMEAEKILRENEIFEANNSYQMREKMKQYLERMLAFFEEQNQNPNYYAAVSYTHLDVYKRQDV